MSTITGPGLDQESVRAIDAAPEARSIEDPNKPISLAELANLLSGGTVAGVSVTPNSAMKLAAVWACVRVISESIARMPFIVYERTPMGRERAKAHPLYWRLKMRPSDDTSSFAFRQALVAQMLLWGNGYAEIVRRGDGRPESLQLVESHRVTPTYAGNRLRYQVAMPAGPSVTLLPRDMIHVPGLSLDGVCGLSVIHHARLTIGAGLSSDKFQSTFLANGMRPSGVLEHPARLGKAATDNLRGSFEAVYGGPNNAGKPMILEEGMKWVSAAMPLVDAQYIETAYLRIEDICRWFGVQPHKIHHLLRATNNNIEHQGLDFLGDALGPKLEGIEQEFNYKLFDEDERDRYYVEHLTQAIIQLDSQARGQWYERMFRVGAISPDEIRERENLNYLPDGRGRTHWTQSSNMPLPTEEQADQLLDSWIKKGGAKPPAKDDPEPEPKTDGKSGA
jgi:HK97 family phage portal protein